MSFEEDADERLWNDRIDQDKLDKVEGNRQSGVALSIQKRSQISEDHDDDSKTMSLLSQSDYMYDYGTSNKKQVK